MRTAGKPIKLPQQLLEPLEAPQGLEGFVSHGSPSEAANGAHATFPAGGGAKTPSVAPADDGGLVIVRASQIKREPQEWLIRNKIPYGQMTLWAGHPGMGKSTSLAALIASFTNRKPLPVTGAIMEPVDALIFSLEQTEAMIRAQAEAAGVDLDRLHVFQATPKNGKKSSKRFDISADIDRLKKTIENTPSIRVIVFDPVKSCINGKVEGNNDIAIRDAIDSVVEMAMERKLALIMVIHLTKAMPLNAPALAQIAGSGAWGQVCRAAFLVRKDGEDPDRALVLCAKSASGDWSGYAFSIESHNFGDGVTAGRAIFEAEAVSESADDVVNASRSGGADGGDIKKIEKAKAFILEVLKTNGRTEKSKIMLLAAGEDIPEVTMNRAFNKLPLVKEKNGVKVIYSLPLSKEETARKAFDGVRIPPAGSDCANHSEGAMP